MGRKGLLNWKLIEGAENLESEVRGDIDGKKILVQPRLFGVVQKITAGEQSLWLLALKEGKILGARCPKCGLVYAPAYVEYCVNPDCRLESLETVELPDVGYLLAEPVVTLFAPGRMDGEAPFCHGQIVLYDGEDFGADNAMMFALRTKTGAVRRGVFKKGDLIKIVFRDEREGLITDVFAVLQSELTPEQLAKSPLFESDLNWTEPEALRFTPNDEYAAAMPGIVEKITGFLKAANESLRNREKLAEANFRLNVLTAGDNFSLFIGKGEVTLNYPALWEEPTATLSLEDPHVFLGWTEGNALTNEFAVGDAWLSHPIGLRILEDLDRLHRNAVRDGVLEA